MKRFTSVRVAHESADALRRLAFTLSAKTGRRVTAGAALAAAVAVANKDIPATLAALPEGRDE